MSDQDIYVKRTTLGIEVTYEGRTATMAGTEVESVESMLASAECDERAAAERAFDARRLRALAAHVAAERDEIARQLGTQRRERAAATRAHNKDPFGFDALRARCAEDRAG